MLSIDELSELQDRVMEAFPDKITGALTLANRKGKLEQLLKLLGMEDLLIHKNKFESCKEGRIVVIGGSRIKEDVLIAIAESMGIDKKRFEFCLDYEAIQKYNFRKLQYQPQYRLILFGPAPHSANEKGDSYSILSELERGEGYPRVERLISGNELKITKSNFRNKLESLLKEGFI